MQLFFQKNKFKVYNVEYITKKCSRKKSESIQL